jgi:hypothetical protein
MPTRNTRSKVRYQPVLNLPKLPHDQFAALRDSITVHGVLVPILTDGGRPGRHAERLLRHGVLWLKNDFGCHGASGCRFVERILTAVQTLRLRGRPVLRYLANALVAHRSGLPAPSLLPIG